MKNLLSKTLAVAFLAFAYSAQAEPGKANTGERAYHQPVLVINEETAFVVPVDYPAFDAMLPYQLIVNDNVFAHVVYNMKWEKSVAYMVDLIGEPHRFT